MKIRRTHSAAQNKRPRPKNELALFGFGPRLRFGVFWPPVRACAFPITLGPDPNSSSIFILSLGARFMDAATPSGLRSRTLRRAVAASAVAGLALIAAPGCRSHADIFAKTIEDAKRNPLPDARGASFAKLGKSRFIIDQQERREAIATLIASLNGKKEPAGNRAEICRSLGELGGPQAREALLTVVNNSDEEAIVRGEACRGLGKVGAPEDATILARIMVLDRDLDTRLAAVNGLASLKTQDDRVLSTLISGMENDDPAVRLASVEALKAATGKDLGLKSDSWRGWLEAKKKGQSASAASKPPAATGTADARDDASRTR